jgi:hypothetical protein
MRKIWKYVLEMKAAIQEIMMPKGARILHFDNQRREPCIWVEVDDTAFLEIKEVREFTIAGTGHPIPIPAERLIYIGTALFDNGEFVWHLYEVGPRKEARKR